VIDGRYRVESYIGGGGMASVYRATHVVLGQSVAIKVISPFIRNLPGMAERFLREARAATHLKSPHVARVSDVGTMQDGAPYMVMEYLEGTDLAALLESHADLSVEEAVDYVLQTCEALAEVHGLGIIHRDLKPGNLFLTLGTDGLPCVKLIDFGISSSDAPLGAEDLVALTQPETVMGSPRYMAPEQMQSATRADARSDIYGLGAVLYELLTRSAPHEGATFLDIFAAVTLGPARAPSTLRAGIPAKLDEVILRCLDIEPAERYPNTAELARALAPFGPAGSGARADVIARILGASRSRTHDSGARHEITGGVESRVHRRVSSSAHSLRKRRIQRGAVVLVAFSLAGLTIGARALYARGEAAGIASTVTSSIAAAPPGLASSSPALAPTAGTPAVASESPASPQAPVAAATAGVEAPRAAQTAPAPVAAEAPRAAQASPIPAQAAPAATTAPATPPLGTTTSPPARSLSTSPPDRAPLAPSTDEPSLFEDRK
jgi:serine/threonine-protein kinase